MGSRSAFPMVGFLPAYLALLVSVVLLASLVPAPLGAEPTSSIGRTHSLCWRGHPYPECRSFLITEVGISYALGSPPAHVGTGAFVADLGLMKSISELAAVGGTAHARLGGDYARAGVRGRYRRWLGRSTSVDLSPGIILVNKDESFRTDYLPPGVVAGAALNLGDLFAFSLEAEYGRYSVTEYVGTEINRSRSSHVTWLAGWRTGSVPGSVGMILFIVGGFIYTMTLGEHSG